MKPSKARKESNLKNYSVVKFLHEGSDEEVSTVPLSWTFVKNNISYCSWPSNSKNYKSLMKKASAPDENWPVYKCQIIRTFGDCDSAIRYEQQFAALESTDYENKPLGKGHRSVQPKIFKDFTDANSSTESEGEDEFTLSDNDNDCAANVTNAATNNVEIDVQQRNTETPQRDIEVRHPDIRTPQNNYPCLSPINILLEDTTIINNGENLHTCCKAYQAEICILTQEVVKLSGLIEEYKNSIETVVTRASSGFHIFPDTNFNLPLNTIEDIKELENKLKSSPEKRAFCQVLRTVGGENVTKLTRRCLGKVFSDDLSRKCSWTGAKNNFKIENLTLISELKGTVKSIYPCGTDTEFEKCAKDFFRYGTQRCERKRKRLDISQDAMNNNLPKS